MAGKFTSIAEAPKLTNRKPDGSFELPTDGKYHIVPIGQFPVTDPDDEEKRIIQVVDDLALEKILNRFQQKASSPDFDGVLVDFEHFSDDLDKESRAAGWLMSLEKRESGLFGEIRWSNSGRRAVEGGDYRRVSPTFYKHNAEHLGGNRYRVTELADAGLTNKPNMRGMKPLSNRSGGPVPTEPETNVDKNKILLLLGLAATATESDIESEITKLRNRGVEFDGLKAELTTLKNRHEALLTVQVESDLKEFETVISADSKEHVRAELLKNREGTLKLLRGLKPAATKKDAPKPLHNREAAKPAEDPTAEVDAAGEARAAKIRNRASAIQREQKLSFSQAWSQAEAEFPEESEAAK